ELARRGQEVWMLTGTLRPGRVMGVNCERHRAMPPEFFKERMDAFVVLNGPADMGPHLRSLLNPNTPLCLWTGHGPTEGAVQSLRTSDIRRAWDRIICVSTWHRGAMIDAFGLEPARVVILRNAIALAFDN